VFRKIADVLSRYGIIEDQRNLRLRFTLCMQEFFDSIPQDQWKIKDPALLSNPKNLQLQDLEWIIEQIT
jgi:hypothetical protein